MKKKLRILFPFIILMITSYTYVKVSPQITPEHDHQTQDNRISPAASVSADLDIPAKEAGKENLDHTQQNPAETKTETSIAPEGSMEGDLSMEQNNDTPHPDRITYRDGFYYEPLTDMVKTRIYGFSYKEDCTVPYEDLRYVKVLFYNFDGKTDEGEIICNRQIAQDLVEIFYELYQNSYPIEKIRLVDEYQADDDASCADNNSSCFNYRVIAGSKRLSKHALGMAIDINPFYNPYITYPNGTERISPAGSEPYADRNADLPHMIQKGDLCYNLFLTHGFTWGGEWKSVKDYQHFEKEQTQ